ncbi:MAG TPA: hypothetical protein H9845_08775 [Candidatus Agathobaculum pullicola]|nr:hypothetical protein [Candidatus Agathobaculum pullicola]
MLSKKLQKAISCVLLLSCMIFAVGAANPTQTETIDYGDGYYLVITTTGKNADTTTRAVTERYIEREARAYHGSTYIGKYTLCGTFIYDGSRSAAIADDWYASSSYGYSGSSSHTGSSVKGRCTFNYAGGKTYTITMTCDKNGNMSYTE